MALYRSYANVNLSRSSSRSRSSSLDRMSGSRRRDPSPSIFPLGRTSSQVFSSYRSQPPGVWERRTPYSTSPYYSDRYPHVKHSHGYEADATAVRVISTLPAYTRSSSRLGQGYGIGRSTTVGEMYPSRYTSSYSSTSYRSPYSSYSSSYSYRTPGSRYGSSLQVDDAVSLYSKRYMTVGTLSKYWLDGGSSPRHSSYTSYSSGYSRPSVSSYLRPSYYSSYTSPSSYSSGYSSMRYTGTSYRTY